MSFLTTFRKEKRIMDKNSSDIRHTQLKINDLRAHRNLLEKQLDKIKVEIDFLDLEIDNYKSFLRSQEESLKSAAF